MSKVINMLKGKKTLVSLLAFLAIGVVTFGDNTTSKGVAPEISHAELTGKSVVGEIEGLTEEQKLEMEEAERVAEEKRLESEKKEEERLEKEKSAR